MARGPANPNRLLGALRYGPSSSSGPDDAARYLDMTPGELADLGCFEFARDAEIIIAAKTRFSGGQLASLRQRANECTGSLDPRLLGDALGTGDAIEDVTPQDVIEGALGAEGLLGGVADVIGNALLALAGLGLVVLGVGRVFGIGRLSPSR